MKKYDYTQASQELKTARNVDEIHAVLEKCTKFALEDLMTCEGLQINTKLCKRKGDWQSNVFSELKRIFEAIGNGEEIKPRHVMKYNAERNTFEMAQGLGEITTAWIERKNTDTSTAQEVNPAETAGFELALERVRDGQYLPYRKYSQGELMRLAEARTLEVPAGMSREEVEEAVMRAGIMNPEEGSFLWAVLLLGFVGYDYEIERILDKCARDIVEQINASEGLGIESEHYPNDVDFLLAVRSKLSEIRDDVIHGESVDYYGEIVSEWIEREELVRNYAALKEIETYIDAHIPEATPAPEAYVDDDYYSDNGGDNSQPEQDIPETHTQEENTMTRTTVSEAVIAVKGATTVEAIKDALMTCTVKDMVKVCAEVTGVENAVKPMGLKAETAERIADFIMRYRKEEEFKALTVAEKYAAMTEKRYSEVCHLSSWCSVEELKEIARMLNCPLDEKYAQYMEHCLCRINDALLAFNMERRIVERIAEGADKEAVKNELKLCSYGIHEALMMRAGIELEGALPRDVVIERLASHFMKSKEPESPAESEPEINPDDTSEGEYNLLQVSINVSMSVRTALKNAMKLLDPRSKDYSVLDELYYCEGLDIEEAIERRRVIHKAITALKEVRARERTLAGVA